MFDLTKEWNLSFAGCGFLGIYHIGVASCLMEQAPYLIKGATKIYGASAGALTASMLASQAPIDKCCEDVIETVKEARKRNLGPLHPSFNLVKVLRTGLERDFPANAHTLASGRLCVSLTRVSDGQNVIVSQFSSKEDLIQALICSCFIPIYCGLIPPSFQGVSELKNTISISPFSGESDICPRDTSFNFHELRFTNTSIQINLGNMYRLSKALFPPEPKVMAEICQNGYKDAFRFLEENHLLKLQYPTAGPSQAEVETACCCKPVVTETTKDWMLRRLRLLREWHWWLDEEIVDNLPAAIKKVFCEACQQKPGLYAHVSQMLPVRVASYMLLPCTLPVVSAYSVGKRFVEWIPEVPADMRWLAGVAGDVAGGVYKQTRRGRPAVRTSDGSLRNCMSLPPSLNNNSLVERDCDLHGLALSDLDLSSHYENIPTGPPSQRSASHLTHSASPGQICFFLGSQGETD
ncbi:hypothetical protein DPEC_G00107350 [Dallia pectoralis]|uniref:Uncharacterized protein n=1 Tax=Dallia pectoralis TaxID=75939 RepID=A0ACC2GS10_DALPE|nr:hypothetical protein DPEC_G00107350 [Dallia pectoralis]